MKHNVYFEGKVQSLALETEEGSATVGVITPGRYAFSTSTEERMVVTSGVLMVKLPDENEWRAVKAGQEFTVNRGASFDVEVAADASYICYYK